MAAVNRGFGATLGIGNESTWGTSVARTNWLRLVSHSMKRTRTKTNIPSLGNLGQVSSNYREHFIESDQAGGDIEWIPAYDDSTLFLYRMALGAVVTSGAGPFTHTFTLASPAPFFSTLELISGTPAPSTGGNMAEVFEGCVADSFDLSVESGGVMRGKMGIIAETSQGQVAAGTPTYSSGGEYVRHNHGGTLTFNSTTRAIKSLNISVKRNLDRNQELGSLFTQRPVEGRLEIEWEAVMLWQAQNWYDELLSDTQGNATCTFAGTGSNALAATLHNSIILDVSNPVNGAGGISRTVRGRAFADASNGGLSLVVTNANAAATTN